MALTWTPASSPCIRALTEDIGLASNLSDEIIPTEPVIRLTVVCEYPVTTTCSRIFSSYFRIILTPPTGAFRGIMYSASSIPRDEIFRATVPFGTFSENEPSTSVVTPMLSCPLQKTPAPMTGWPSVSTTVPLMTMSCAERLKTDRNKRENMVISVNLLQFIVVCYKIIGGDLPENALKKLFLPLI